MTEMYGQDFAAMYNEGWAFWGRKMWPLLAAAVERDNPTARTWLDLCCGTGSLLQILGEQGYAATGVDRSPHQLAHVGGVQTVHVLVAPHPVEDRQLAVVRAVVEHRGRELRDLVVDVEEVKADHAGPGQKHHGRFSAARAVKSQVPPLDVVETPDWWIDPSDLVVFEFASSRAFLLSLSLVELGHVSFLLERNHVLFLLQSHFE